MTRQVSNVNYLLLVGHMTLEFYLSPLPTTFLYRSAIQTFNLTQAKFLCIPNKGMDSTIPAVLRQQMKTQPTMSDLVSDPMQLLKDTNISAYLQGRRVSPAL